MLGILVALFSFVYGAIILLSYLLGGIPVQGWTPMMLVVTFSTGLQMFMLGVLGEYLWRTLDEVRRRPPYVIDEVWDGEYSLNADRTDTNTHSSPAR
jgi:dolichol-phosphate mannosyltransferase